MIGSAEVEEPESAVEGAPDGDFSSTDRHMRAATKEELTSWLELTLPQRDAALRNVIAKFNKASPEVLVQLCCQASAADDRKRFNLAFEALAVTVTPLLLHQARAWNKEERKDKVQDVLMHTFNAIRAGKANLAGNNFALFSRRRIISLYRQSKGRFEGFNTRIEATDERDPVDQLVARCASPEDLVLLRLSLEKLTPKQREVFIQAHALEMKQKEIAALHRVNVRTVYDWLKEAEKIVGVTGAEDEE